MFDECLIFDVFVSYTRACMHVPIIIGVPISKTWHACIADEEVSKMLCEVLEKQIVEVRDKIVVYARL